MSDYLCIFWDCPAIQPAWLEIVTEIECFGPIYLGNMPTDFNAPDKYPLQVLRFANMKAITKKWLHAPTKEAWRMIERCMIWKKCTLSLRLYTDKFH